MASISYEDIQAFPHALKLRWTQHRLKFKTPAATSRGSLCNRTTYIIEAETPAGIGLGECCTMPGLLPEIQTAELDSICRRVEREAGLGPFSAPSPIQFGLECALIAALHPHKPRWITPFTQGKHGLRIHHLIWMDSVDRMLISAQKGIESGFNCLKLKVGALPVAEEVNMLHLLRSAYPQAEIRIDANGAFSPEEAIDFLDKIGNLNISYIEQPIKAGDTYSLAKLSQRSPVPIALDESLMACRTTEDIKRLLDDVMPAAIVIKPSLHGGLYAASIWGHEASCRGIQWWCNSALESNIGLTALAEWCSVEAASVLHGLGTGRLYEENFDAPIRLSGAELVYAAIS